MTQGSHQVRRPRKIMPRWPALALGVSLCGSACAADQGDPPKVDGGSSYAPSSSGGPGPGVITGEEATTSNGDGATNGGDSQTIADGSTTTPTDSALSPEDAQNTSPDAGVAATDAAAVPPEAGAGCASGAMVITLMPGLGHSANTGNFNTTAPVCVQLMGSVNQGWCISNGMGRTFTLTSAAGTSAPTDGATGCYSSLPAAPQAGPDGYVYWNFTAESDADSTDNYTSLYVY